MTHHPDCACSEEHCTSVGGYSPRHDSAMGNCHCGQPCTCERLIRAEQRGREKVAQMWDSDKDTFPGRISAAYYKGQHDTIVAAMKITQRELDDPQVTYSPVETTLERIRDEIEMLGDSDERT